MADKIDKALDIASKGVDKIVTDQDRIGAIQEYNNLIDADKENIRDNYATIQSLENASFLAKNIKEILAILIVVSAIACVFFQSQLQIQEVASNRLIDLAILVGSFYFGSMYKELKFNNQIRKDKFDKRHERKMARISR